MYTELRNRGRVGLIAGFVALLLFAVVAPSGLLGSAGVGAQPVTTAVGALPVPNPESIVVVEQDGGQLSLVDAGKATKVADGLVKPNGVGVLADGSMVVADSGNNRLVGIGGRFGNAFKEIAKDLEFPEGVGVGLDGTVYVSLLLKGEVGKVDLQTGKYSTIAKELKGPGQIAVRSGKLYVPQATADPPNVLEIGADGKKTVVASGFEQPIGIVAGPGKSLYVSDFKAGKIDLLFVYTTCCSLALMQRD